MLKWMFKAGRLLATAVLLSFLSVWTTGYIVNSYVETVLKQIGLPLQVQPPGLTGFWGKMWGVDAPADAESKQPPGGPGRPQSLPNLHQPEEPDFPAHGAEDEVPEAAGPMDPPTFGAGGEPFSISDDDRETLREIMMKLNEEELMQLTRLLSDGWTASDWASAATLFESALSAEDYNILMEIISRVVSIPHDRSYPAENQAF